MKSVLAGAGAVVLAVSRAWAHPGHADLPSPIDGHAHGLFGGHEMTAIAAFVGGALLVMLAARRAAKRR